jgi:hypothetical protein
MATTVQEMEFGHFSNRIGRSFDVAVSDHRLALVLEAAQSLPGSPRPGGAFRLEFVGPPDPVLAQGIFPFVIDGERFEIFVVTIAHDSRRTRYEAVFF